MYIHELNQQDVQDAPYPGTDISIKSLFLNKCQKIHPPPPPQKNEIKVTFIQVGTLSHAHTV